MDTLTWKGPGFLRSSLPSSLLPSNECVGTQFLGRKQLVPNWNPLQLCFLLCPCAGSDSVPHAVTGAAHGASSYGGAEGAAPSQGLVLQSGGCPQLLCPQGLLPGLPSLHPCPAASQGSRGLGRSCTAACMWGN